MELHSAYFHLGEAAGGQLPQIDQILNFLCFLIRKEYYLQ